MPRSSGQAVSAAPKPGVVSVDRHQQSAWSSGPAARSSRHPRGLRKDSLAPLGPPAEPGVPAPRASRRWRAPRTGPRLRPLLARQVVRPRCRSHYRLKAHTAAVPLLDQALGLGAGLLTAYVTGTWRKYGHRLERLHELRLALPDNAVDLQVEFDKQLQEEAKRLIKRGLVRPPAHIVVSRLALRSAITLWALLLVLAIAGKPPAVALEREFRRLQIESQQPRGLPLWASITNDAVILISIPLGIVCGFIVLEYWYSRLATKTWRQRVSYVLASGGLGFLTLGSVLAVVRVYDPGFTNTANAADAVDRLGPPFWIRYTVVILLAGLGVLQAWRRRHP